MRKFQEEPRKAELALKAFSFSFDQILQQGENAILGEMSLCEPQHCQTKQIIARILFLALQKIILGIVILLACRYGN